MALALFRALTQGSGILETHSKAEESKYRQTFIFRSEAILFVCTCKSEMLRSRFDLVDKLAMVERLQYMSGLYTRKQAARST